MTRSGTVTLRIPPEACPPLAGAASCKGAVDLRTVDPVRLTPRGRLTRRILASASYQLRPGAQAQATLRLSKRQRSLLQRRGRLLVIATVTAVLDRTGKLTSTGYPFVLLRPRRPVS